MVLMLPVGDLGKTTLIYALIGIKTQPTTTIQDEYTLSTKRGDVKIIDMSGIMELESMVKQVLRKIDVLCIVLRIDCLARSRSMDTWLKKAKRKQHVVVVFTSKTEITPKEKALMDAKSEMLKPLRIPHFHIDYWKRDSTKELKRHLQSLI